MDDDSAVDVDLACHLMTDIAESRKQYQHSPSRQNVMHQHVARCDFVIIDYWFGTPGPSTPTDVHTPGTEK
jgi:hypothetical protein